jgi:molybdopterin molybdotransferase
LRKLGQVPAGQNFSGEIEPGSCVRIFTGSPIPRGADAVVMQEEARETGELARILASARPLENVRLKGEDIRAGSLLVQKGKPIDGVECGILASAGVASVAVSRRPVIALLATGSELREAGEALAQGQIYEGNRNMLAGLLTEMGCDVMRLPLVPDDLESTKAALADAFARSDMVVSTGGVSVGEFDFVKSAFVHLNGQINLWRIAIRPGKPFVFGTLAAKHLCGLPGNPVSALVTFLLLARPAIRKMQGAANLELPLVDGYLDEPLFNRADRRHFVRVAWENGRVRVAGPQASHRIRELTQSNGLLDAAPGISLKEGDRVSVQLWRHL